MKAAIHPHTNPPVRIDWQNDKDAPIGRVVNLDNMEPISGVDGWCFFVDEATGEWKRYAARNGVPIFGEIGQIVIERGIGRVKFFPFQGTDAEFRAFLLDYYDTAKSIAKVQA